MGLLDDAIREHLELKRLRGADPGEVTRAEREALDPIPRDGELALEPDSGPAGDVANERTDDAGALGETRAKDRSVEPHESDQPMSLPDDPQETAELDMRSLLREKQDAIPQEDPEDGVPEWKVQGETAGGQPLSTEGEEPSHDAFSAAYGSSGDTPEQRHLWPEQRASSDTELDR